MQVFASPHFSHVLRGEPNGAVKASFGQGFVGKRFLAGVCRLSQGRGHRETGQNDFQVRRSPIRGTAPQRLWREA